MTAAVVIEPGPTPPAQAFAIDDAYPKPTLPGPGWLLVRVKAAGCNRAELRGRTGFAPGVPEFGPFQAEYHPDPPRVLGEEFVGVVEQVGADCANAYAATTWPAGRTAAGRHTTARTRST
jgi:NADPH2:quinone reductase